MRFHCTSFIRGVRILFKRSVPKHIKIPNLRPAMHNVLGSNGYFAVFDPNSGQQVISSVLLEVITVGGDILDSLNSCRIPQFSISLLRR